MGANRTVVSPVHAHPSSALNDIQRYAGRANMPALVVLTLAIGWAFWPTLTQLFGCWMNDPQYSHGVLVPIFAGALLWMRRNQFPVRATPAPILGMLVMVLAWVCRLAGGVLYIDWLEQMALIPCLLGLTLAYGGWPVLRWSLPAVLFLVFMIPMPYRITIWLGFPLQRFATDASTYVLQTLGQPAIAEGNTILIRDFQLSIVKACNGLSMLVTFITFSTAVCLLVKKPFSDKLIILFSAIPIALAANVLRIVVTGLMFLHVSNQAATSLFHDMAGWFMMPLALLFLGAELWVLKRLFIEQPRRLAFR